MDGAQSTSGGPISADEARALILNEQATAGMWVRGALDLSGVVGLATLPANLRVGRLDLSGCITLRELPPGLRCYDLDLSETPLRSLPPDLRVENRLDLSDCAELESLPEGLSVGALDLRNCVSLRALPEGLSASYLDVSGCSGLRGWPTTASVGTGRLSARGCAWVTELPPWLRQVSQLDVCDCVNLTALPEGLRVSSWIDLGHTGITALPASLRGVRLRWGGVLIDERTAFHPETITGQEILSESNAELRRVKLERLGNEAFLEQVRPEVLDEDTDAGGARRLLKVEMEDDEPLVCLAVRDPSTGRSYMLRVPPDMATCKQAAAWTAGFDHPKHYQPVVET